MKLYNKEPQIVFDEKSIIRNDKGYVLTVEINKEQYYFKRVSSDEAINEILGTKLANLFGLETAIYEPARFIENNTITDGVVSKDFDKEDKLLYLAELYDFQTKLKGFNRLDEFINKFSKVLDEKAFIDKLIRTIAIDFYMNQIDRCKYNIVFDKKDNGILEIGPLYDYSAGMLQKCDMDMTYIYSYYYNNNWLKNNKYVFSNAFVKIDFPGKSYNELLERYPNINNYLKTLYKTNIYNIIKDIISNNMLDIPWIKEYETYTSIKKEKIKQLIK